MKAEKGGSDDRLKNDNRRDMTIEKEGGRRGQKEMRKTNEEKEIDKKRVKSMRQDRGLAGEGQGSSTG